MRTILHILTRPEDQLTGELIERQRALPETQVQVVSLAEPAPDYGYLLCILLGVLLALFGLLDFLLRAFVFCHGNPPLCLRL